MIERKICFKCKNNKPLFLFKKNRMKYQLISDKGRVIECRFCNIKRFINQKGKIIKFNHESKKFEFIISKVNFFNIVKEYFNN